MKIKSDLLVETTYVVLLILLLSVVLLTGCATVPKQAPTPVLSPAGTKTLDVRFLGVPYEAADLWVCGKVPPDPLSCVEYSYFQSQLQRAGR